MARKITPPAVQEPKDTLNALCGRRLSSLGDFERLAGVDTCNDAERSALWAQFSHLNAASIAGDHQPLFDAVTNHCARIALERLARGELTLLPPGYAYH